MSNYRIDHKIPKGPEGINGYNSGKSPFDYPKNKVGDPDWNGDCAFGEIYVHAYRKKDGTLVSPYCRKMTKNEMKDTYGEGGVHLKPTETGEGYYEATAKEPLEAINEILRQFNYYDRGDIEYTSPDGGIISDKEFDKKGGDFHVFVTGYQHEYSIDGTVSKKRGKWVAGAEAEEPERD